MITETDDSGPPWAKGVGLTLALLSGTLIGLSVVFTRRGLTQATARGFDAASGSHGYIYIPSWWAGMILSESLHSILPPSLTSVCFS